MTQPAPRPVLHVHVRTRLQEQLYRGRLLLRKAAAFPTSKHRVQQGAAVGAGGARIGACGECLDHPTHMRDGHRLSQRLLWSRSARLPRGECCSRSHKRALIGCHGGTSHALLRKRQGGASCGAICLHSSGVLPLHLLVRHGYIGNAVCNAAAAADTTCTGTSGGSGNCQGSRVLEDQHDCAVKAAARMRQRAPRHLLRRVADASDLLHILLTGLEGRRPIRHTSGAGRSRLVWGRQRDHVLPGRQSDGGIGGWQRNGSTQWHCCSYRTFLRQQDDNVVSWRGLI
mmetsp:Transcript_66712/g.214937  ORF Transcript_66712/g.214937 Transcript_66712/m.214937 type:complete len:285 (-) Transcript_66712:630-1484(-)